ncbi:hypothetical protein, partial [Mycobacterium sp. 1245801.1]|uniref:hypothetical protein n=1 Tax=Mycobacterium sp. 1245801.1 TaxID=1834075 RepID=UPI000AB2713D
GAQGIWNAQGQCRGIYDAPVKTTWKTGAFQDGSTQKAKKVLHRDLELGFHCVETRIPPRSAEDNESEFRKIFDYDVDEWDDDPEPTTIHLETDRSGERKLDLLLSSADRGGIRVSTQWNPSSRSRCRTFLAFCVDPS